MGKTPGKWIKALLLGKKSPKSNLGNQSEKLRSAKKEEVVVSVTEDLSNLTLDPSVVPSQRVTASTPQNVVSPNNCDELNDNVELQQAAIKVQAAFRAHQARRSFRTLKGIIRLQAVIRGHLVRRQAIATYSCIWGIVKFQALVRGQKARSSDNEVQFQKTHMEAGDSEALQSKTYSRLENPTRFVFVNKLLASSLSTLPLKIQYGPEEPNSTKVWLVRWTQLQVWSSGSRIATVEVPKSQSKKRNYQAVVESEKARTKRGVKKPSSTNSGTGSSRSTAESLKPKRNVRKASTLSKDGLRTESEKAKPHSRKSRSASKEGSPLGIKDEKPSASLRKSSLSNGSKKASVRSAEKKKNKDIGNSVEHEEKVSRKVLEQEDNTELAEMEKNTLDSVKIELEEKVPEGDNIVFAQKEKDTVDSVHIESEGNVVEGEGNTDFAEKEKDVADSVRIEPEGKVLEGGNTKFDEKEKDIADSVQIEPEGKVLVGGDSIKFDEKEKDITDAVLVEFDVVQDENSPVLDKPEEDEPKTTETNDKGEDLKCSDMKVTSENSTKPTETLLPAKVDSQGDRLTHSGRKIPSYMAPTASAKARIKGEGSPRFSLEKTEINGALRRHSLPSLANGSSTMSPRAHKLLLSSAKGSMNGDKSFTSSKDISHKSTRNDWKR